MADDNDDDDANSSKAKADHHHQEDHAQEEEDDGGHGGRNQVQAASGEADVPGGVPLLPRREAFAALVVGGFSWVIFLLFLGISLFRAPFFFSSSGQEADDADGEEDEEEQEEPLVQDEDWS